MNEDEIRNIVSELLDQDSRNITRELYQRALRETCEYIENNMPFVKSNFKDRFELLEFAAKSVSIDDGLWLEFGVYKGKTIRFIADKSGTVVYGFDSFDGNPDNWRGEYLKGVFALKEIPEFPKNIHIVEGWFEDTLPEFLFKHDAFVAFMHIDCDLYSSTKTIFELLGNKIGNGSILVFDEFFNYPGWKNHEFIAFTEFVQDNKKKYEYIGYVYKHSQVAIRIVE